MSDPVPQLLTPGIRPNLATFQTARALQRHQEWVSQPPEKVPALVQAAGFQLVGDVVLAHKAASQGYVAVRDNQVVVAFRGSRGSKTSETLFNTLMDVDSIREAPTEIVPQSKLKGIKVHQGFYEDYLGVRDAVQQRVSQFPDAELFVTGFSLGSQLATLCSLDLAISGDRTPTFHGMGTARVGNMAFVKLFNSKVNGLRTIFTLDPFPRVPFYRSDRAGYVHVGKLAELNTDGSMVPLDAINGRFATSTWQFKDHNRDKYRDMIGGFVKLIQQDPQLLKKTWGAGPLQAAALAERETAERQRRASKV